MSRPALPRDLLLVLAAVDDPRRVGLILGDLLTPAEIEGLGERWEIVKRLAGGETQRGVSQALGVSVTTVSRGSRQLKYGEGGFELAFDSLVELGRKDPRAP